MSAVLRPQTVVLLTFNA